MPLLRPPQPSPETVPTFQPVRVPNGGIYDLGCRSHVDLGCVQVRWFDFRDSDEGSAMARASNVILVHGAWADGSSWSKVIPLLLARGLRVTAVQLPLTSMKDDVATVKRALALEDGPTVLVGHSYGGVVITEAGNDPKVSGLVYLAAFAPDKGESVSALIKNPPPGAPVPPILPPQDGFLLLDRTKFRASFAADVRADLAPSM